MLYSRETIKATKKAVEKWELICNCAGEDNDCALCDIFLDKHLEELMPDEENVETYGDNWVEGCFGCPIYEFTGVDCTDGTPYKAWYKYWNSQYIGTLVPTKQIENLETQEMAIAELEFIRKIFIKTLLLSDIVNEYHYKVMRCLDFDEDCKTIIGANATAYCHAYTPERGYCPFLREERIVSDNRSIYAAQTEEVKE